MRNLLRKVLLALVFAFVVGICIGQMINTRAERPVQYIG